MYSSSSTFSVGMYPFCDFVPIVIESRHAYMVLQFFLLPVCQFWKTGHLFAYTCLGGGLWFAFKSAQHLALCIQFAVRRTLFSQDLVIDVPVA